MVERAEWEKEGIDDRIMADKLPIIIDVPGAGRASVERPQCGMWRKKKRVRVACYVHCGGGGIRGVYGVVGSAAVVPCRGLGSCVRYVGASDIIDGAGPGPSVSWYRGTVEGIAGADGGGCDGG